jgi:TetR/AcrR family transcriptional regulator, fatty acid metabolism regulator protein
LQGDKRSAILDAALRVFAKHGYASARVSDIASEAGVGKGTVYLYFKSKEDLLMGVFEARVGEILSMIDELAVSGVSPREGLRTFFDAALDLVASNVEMLDLFEQRVFLSDDRLRARGIAFFRSIIERVVSKLTPEVKSNLALDYDIEIIATAIIGALASYRLYRVLHPEGPAEELLQKVSAELSRFFAAAFLPHSP